MEKITEALSKSYDYLFAVFILALPFSKALPNLILGLLALVFLLRVKNENLSSYIKSPFLWTTLLVVYLIIKAVINQTLILDVDFYKKYAYLLFIPILVQGVRKDKLLKIALLVAVNLSIFVSFYKIYIFYKAFKFFPFSEGWATNFVLVFERPYAGMLSVLSIIISFELFKVRDRFQYLYLTSLLLSVFFIFLIAIRISILTVLFLGVIYLLFFSRVQLKKKLLLFCALFLFLGGALVTNKNIANRFFVKSSLKETMLKIEASEPRVIIWRCAANLIEQDYFSIFFGSPSNTFIESSLQNCYKEQIVNFSRRDWFITTGYNTHNEFIDIYLIGGVLGLGFLILFFVKSFVIARSDFFAFSILCSFVLILFVENIFHRQLGCFIFTTFIALFLRNKKING